MGPTDTKASIVSIVVFLSLSIERVKPNGIEKAITDQRKRESF